MPQNSPSSAGLLATPLLVASALGLAAPATAQFGTPNVRVVASTGDVYNGRTIDRLRAPSVAPDGRWAAICGIQNTLQNGLLVEGNLVIAEGDMTADGSILDRINTVCMSSDGTVALLFEIQGPTEPIGRLRIGSSVVLEEGRPFSFPLLSLSGTIDGFYGMDYDAPNLCVGLFIRTPAGAIERAFLTGTVAGSTFTPQDGVKGGFVHPDSTSGIPYFSPNQDCQVVSGGGACHTVNLNGGAGFTQALFSKGALIAEGDQPGPAPNSVWNFDGFPRVRTNTGTSSLYTGQLTLSNGQDRGVVYLDGTPVAVEGGGLNGIFGAVGEFQVASIALTDDNTPFFTVPLTTAGVEVLMAGSEPVLRSGTGGFATQINGTTVTSLYAGVRDQSFDVSSDGRVVAQRAQLGTGETVILLAEPRISDPVNCTTVPNSTGMSGRVAAFGSRILSYNDLTIAAFDLPPDSFGYLGISTDSVFVANPGGSTGNLCVGPTVGRFIDQVQSSGPNGRIETVIDLNAVPQPTGFVTSMIGDRWYCQLWHRDSVMGSATSNFTDAISVELQ